MGEQRRLTELEGLPQQQVLRGVGHVVLTPDHVGDGHVPVVYDVGQNEQGLAVGLADAEVLDGGVLVNDLAPDHVVPGGRADVGRAEPQEAPDGRLEATVAAVAVVAGRRAGRLVALGDIRRDAVACVGQVLVPVGGR